MAEANTRLARAFLDAREFESAVDITTDVSALLYQTCACTERGEYKKALSILSEMVIDSAAPRIKWSFYHQRALAHSRTGNQDAALIDYTAARDWARESGEDICQARTQNNLAKLYSEVGRLDEALEEVNCAIKIATRVSDQSLLGRFTDQKAQILLEHDQLSEAVDTARRAVGLLELHGNETTLSEARETYGKALIRYGILNLNRIDPVRSHAAKNLSGVVVKLEAELLQDVLDRTQGMVTPAAAMLGEHHTTVMKAIDKYKLDRKPKRRRAKSLILHQK